MVVKFCLSNNVEKRYTYVTSIQHQFTGLAGVTDGLIS